MIDVRVLAATDVPLLERVAPGLFDKRIRRELATEFLNDPRHHVVAAIDGDVVVGFVSAVHYVHPDKPTELWINEVAVAPTHHNLGIGRRLVAMLVAHGEAIGCNEAWVLTSPDNEPAKRMYRAAGATPHEELSVMFTYRTQPRGDDG